MNIVGKYRNNHSILIEKRGKPSAMGDTIKAQFIIFLLRIYRPDREEGLLLTTTT